jgi:hypothetical protein
MQMELDGFVTVPEGPIFSTILVSAQGCDPRHQTAKRPHRMAWPFETFWGSNGPIRRLCGAE